MILLSGHSLTAVRKVPAEAMSLTLNERESSATFTPRDLSGISVGSWLKDDRKPGNGIVWRVKSITQTYLTDTPQIALEHAVNTLRDRILFGEITPATITGTVGATTCTAKQAVQYILAQQSDWTLGTFDFESVSNPYHFDGDTLFDALETVSNSLTDAWWSYDFSTYPFKLNITEKSATVGTLLRAGRNLSAVSKTIDMAGMFTRFYPIGKDDLHISGNYVSRNENLYGAIAKVEVDTSLTTTAELTAWANDRLRVHAEPKVTINVNGFELADATGESLDALELGKKCRIPLPEYGTEITETITQLVYQDKIFQPEVVQITLANTKTDVTRIIADAIKQAGSGGRGSARQEKEDHAWFEDTDEYVAMVAQKTGINSLGQDETLYSRIQVEAGRITAEVTRATEAEGNMSSLITQTANAITAEVTRATTAEGTLSGAIQVEAGKVSQIVTAVGDNGQVTAASIVTKINESTGQGEVHIDADHVYINAGASDEDNVVTVIGGKTTLAEVEAEKLNATYLNSLIGAIPVLGVRSLSVSGTGANISCVGYVYAEEFVLGSNSSSASGNQSVSSAVKELQIVAGSGTDTYKLQKKSFGDSSWVDVGTFSSAASRQAGWTAAYGKLDWPDAGTTDTATFKGPAATEADTPNQQTYEAKVSIDSSYAYVKHGSTTIARIANSPYSSARSDGWTAAYGKLDWPDAGTTTTATFKGPSSGETTTGGQQTYDAVLSIDNSYAYLKHGSTVIARIANTPRDNVSCNSITATAVSGTTDKNSNTITATLSNTKTGTATISIEDSGYADGGHRVKVKLGSTYILQHWYDAADITSASLGSYGGTGTNWTLSYTIAGKAKTKNYIDCAAAWKKGWNDCKDWCEFPSGATKFYRNTYPRNMYAFPGASNPETVWLIDMEHDVPATKT